MNRLLKINPEWFLRLGLGGVYLYTSTSILRNPAGWSWAVDLLPQTVQGFINGISVDNYLRLQAAGELAIALIMFAWFLPKKVVRVAALLVSLQLLAIILLVGVNLETFRDVGLLGAGIALFLILK